MNNTVTTIPVIRQRRASNIDIKSITQNGGIMQNQNKTRRKSLPALGAPSARVSYALYSFHIIAPVAWQLLKLFLSRDKLIY